MARVRFYVPGVEPVDAHLSDEEVEHLHAAESHGFAYDLPEGLEITGPDLEAFWSGLRVSELRSAVGPDLDYAVYLRRP